MTVGGAMSPGSGETAAGGGVGINMMMDDGPGGGGFHGVPYHRSALSLSGTTRAGVKRDAYGMDGINNGTTVNNSHHDNNNNKEGGEPSDLGFTAFRRATSSPLLEARKERRLLDALKNQQLWLVRWMLSRDADSVASPPGSNANGGGGGRPRSSSVTVEIDTSPPPAQSYYDERDSDGRTPLHFAARWGNMEVIKALVGKKCDPQASDVHGHTPADEAEYWGHIEAMEYLRGLSLSQDAMVRLVESGDVRGLKQFLLRGNQVKLKLEDSDLLHRAAHKGDEAMIRLLLSAGLDPMKRSKDGRTAAEVALMSGRMEVYDMLSPLRRSHGQPTPQGGGQAGSEEDRSMAAVDKTPLHAAAECGSLEAVLRLGKEWPVNCLDSELNTPLHCAIMAGHVEVAKALVKQLKADVNKRNRWGTTPLAEAVRLNRDEIADMLRDHGACLFLEIDSQQVIMEPRDMYFLRLELATSLLFWATYPRPSLVRFFHTTHHNSLLLCCSVRPRLVPDNRSSSSSMRSWNSAASDELDSEDSGDKGDEECDAVLSHLVLDDRGWFLSKPFQEGTPLVIAKASERDPNDLFLSPVLAYTQNRHMAVVPITIDGRRLGAFLLMYKGQDEPKLSTRLAEELRLVVSGTDADLSRWLSGPYMDATRLQILVQSRFFKHMTRDWIAAIYSHESYNFYQPNRQMLAVLGAIDAQRRTFLLSEVCQRCPWVQKVVDAIFYQVDVLLPITPSRNLYCQNADVASSLRAVGMRPPDYRVHDSPAYTAWTNQLLVWIEKAEPLERQLQPYLMPSLPDTPPSRTASNGSSGSSNLTATQHVRTSSFTRSSSIGTSSTGSSSLAGGHTSAGLLSISTSGGGGSAAPPAVPASPLAVVEPPKPWAFSHRDVFDLIGKHKYDHTLPDLLTSLADATQPFPWYDPAFAESLANKLAGSGAMRQAAVLGVVTHYLYRTFLPHQELVKAWCHLRRTCESVIAMGRPSTAAFLLYKSILEFLHPFHDGNGRFARAVASIMVRRGGFTRVLINSDNKILSPDEFFKLLIKERQLNQRLLQQQQEQQQQALLQQQQQQHDTMGSGRTTPRGGGAFTTLSASSAFSGAGQSLP